MLKINVKKSIFFFFLTFSIYEMNVVDKNV